MKFAQTLLNWYQINKRDLPWRHSKDPYVIWLSEIILQQTRVAQGLPYFLKFHREFPTVFKFASASENQILKLWQGLGYYSRARNMLQAARTIVNDYNGVFPEDYKELKNLKGIGDYTASAIASFAFNKPTPVVDGNVFRFLSRHFGILEPIDTTEGKKTFKSLTEKLICEINPGEYNQAIMEFGALHCSPDNPDCLSCPFKDSCVAFSQSSIRNFPVKSKLKKVKTRHFNYLVLVNQNKTFLTRRSGNDIWKNLFEFPLIESEIEMDLPALINMSSFSEIIHDRNQISVKNNPVILQHKLTHQLINAKFWSFEVKNDFFISKSDIFEIGFEEMESKLPVPRLIEKYCLKNLNQFK